MVLHLYPTYKVYTKGDTLRTEGSTYKRKKGVGRSYIHSDSHAGSMVYRREEARRVSRERERGPVAKDLGT